MRRNRWFWVAVCLMMAFPGLAASEKAAQKKVSELLKKANDLVLEAQAAYVDGDNTKAIELYREALKEIERVEQENPSRMNSSEFAPVRFRKALCETEVDRIILEDANATARTLSVTDTSDLEKKRADRKRQAKADNVPEKAVPLTAKRADGSAVDKEAERETADDEPAEPAAKKRGGDDKTPKTDVKRELDFARDMLSIDRYEDARLSLIKVLKADPENTEANLLIATVLLYQNKPKDAMVALEDLLEDRPDDEATLLLAAGVSFALADYRQAMTHLERVMKVNPKRPEGYFNMAWTLLTMAPNDLSQPEMYYRQSVKLGGARDPELERRLGIKAE
ncbi:MAG: tetratricopeptide repeat protein [Kiritimatiellae bacterium]|nr:tetratricopeptide repeat protein [Kiritimatiellia bacterium]